MTASVPYVLTFGALTSVLTSNSHQTVLCGALLGMYSLMSLYLATDMPRSICHCQLCFALCRLGLNGVDNTTLASMITDAADAVDYVPLSRLPHVNI